MLRRSAAKTATTLITLIIILLGSASAKANEFVVPDRKWGNIGAWHVYANRAQNSCFAFSSFEDGTHFWYGISDDRKRSLLAITNKAWDEIAVGETYKLSIVFDGTKSVLIEFEGFKFSDALGYQAFSSDSAVAKDIARLNVVQFFKSDKELTILPLKGTSAALQESEKCRIALSKDPIGFFAAAHDGNRAIELNTRAQGLERKGRFDEAAKFYEEAIAFIQNTKEPDSLDLAMVLLNFSQLQSTQGDYSEAEVKAEKALSILRIHLPDNHWQIGRALNDLGLINKQQGFLEKAVERLELARTIADGVPKLRHHQLLAIWGNLAQVYSSLGRYSEAKVLFEKGVEVSELHFGRDHPNTAFALNDLGAFLLDQGNYTEAVRILERAHEIRISEKKLGSENLELATSHHNLAALFRELGRYKKAETHQTKSLEIRKQLLGPDHPDVASNLNNLGVLYQLMGRYNEAELVLENALNIRQKTLGATHPDFALSLTNLAEIYKDQARYVKALSFYERALEIRRTVVGESHADFARTLGGMADVLLDQGKFDEAELAYQDSLDGLRTALGENHPSVSIALNNVANLHRETGNFAKAEELYLQVLVSQQETFGEEHPNIAIPLNNLGLLYSEIGRLKLAESYLRQAIDIQERSLGSGHPDTVSSLINLSSILEDKGDFVEAKEFLTQAQNIIQSKFGKEHPQSANITNNLGSLYLGWGKFEEAHNHIDYSLNLFGELFGEDSYGYTIPLYNLFVLNSERGKYSEAIDNINNIINIRRNVMGEKHAGTIEAQLSLASIHSKVGRFEEAELIYRQAGDELEAIYGHQHPSVAQHLINLAAFYIDLDRFEEAEEKIREAIVIWELIFGIDNHNVAEGLLGLSHVKIRLGDYNSASDILRRALGILKATYGEEHPKIGSVLSTLGVAAAWQGKDDEAEALHLRSLTIAEKYWGIEHPEYATVLNNVGLNHVLQGRYDEGIPFLQQSLGILENVFGQESVRLTKTLGTMAVASNRNGLDAEADSFMERAITIAESSYNPSHRELLVLYALQARLQYSNGEYDTALDISRTLVQGEFTDRDTYLALLDKMSRESGGINLDKAVSESFSVIQSLAASHASQAISQATARHSTGSGRLADLIRQSQDLGYEIEAIKIGLDKALTRPASSRDFVEEDNLRKRIAKTHEELQKILNRIQQDFPDFSELVKPTVIQLGEVQRLLDADEALIVINLSDETNFEIDLRNMLPRRDYIWAITREDAVWEVMPSEPGEISEIISNLRKALQFRSSYKFDAKMAHQLYQYTIGRLESVVASKKELHIVSNSAFTGIPPHILITSPPPNRELTHDELRRVDWLVDRYAITILPSIASLRQLQGRDTSVAARLPFIGFGDPIFQPVLANDPAVVNEPSTAVPGSFGKYFRGALADLAVLARFQRLPETADELRIVASSLGASDEFVMLREEATETELKKIDLTEFNIVYFATHAMVAGEVQRIAKAKAEPAIVLTLPTKATELDDGLLTASEITMLKLNADWVVLSACNTAAGGKPGAEALSGLARAFFYAGSRSLLVSHWNVYSKPTVDLMGELFSRLEENPEIDPSEALRQSMLSMINDPVNPKRADPKYWAPFVLVGDPRR